MQESKAKPGETWQRKWRRLMFAINGSATRPEKRSRLQRAYRYIIRLSDAYATHQCGLMACAIAYCVLLSLIPLLVVGIAALGYFIGGSQAALHQTLIAIRGYIPLDSRFLKEMLTRILEDRGLIGLFGLIGLMFAAHQAFLAMIPAMNLVWNVPEKRHWLKQRLVAFEAAFLTLLLFGGSLVVSGVFVYLHEYNVPIVPSRVVDALFDLAFGLLPVLLTTLLFTILYQTLPARDVSRRASFLGAGVAAVLWELTKLAFFRFYLAHFHGYDRIYGPLSVLVVLMIWMYYSMAILLLGAEIAADFETMRLSPKAAEARAHSGADLAAAHGNTPTTAATTEDTANTEKS